MNDLQRHRGPTAKATGNTREGTSVSGTGASALSTAPGQQPMRDEGALITFNGEIYNYRELRQELGPSGSGSESGYEVILQAHQ
ncbi:MAG: hypothetical protein U0231_00735 [Nitrospiraceae bacterium]